MAQPLDRATRKIVEEYRNENSGETLDGENQVRGEAAPKAFDVLDALLKECTTAEINAAQGRRAFVSVGRIRQLIAEGLS